MVKLMFLLQLAFFGYQSVSQKPSITTLSISYKEYKKGEAELLKSEIKNVLYSDTLGQAWLVAKRLINEIESLDNAKKSSWEMFKKAGFLIIRDDVSMSEEIIYLSSPDSVKQEGSLIIMERLKLYNETFRTFRHANDSIDLSISDLNKELDKLLIEIKFISQRKEELITNVFHLLNRNRLNAKQLKIIVLKGEKPMRVITF